MLARFLLTMSLMSFSSVSFAIHFSEKDIHAEMANSTVFMQMPQGICSGVLIKQNLILTAAHCFEEIKLESMVLNTYLADTRTPTKQEFKNVFINKNKEFDIALVYLESAINSAKASNYLVSELVGYSEEPNYCILGAGSTEEGYNLFANLGQSCANTIFAVKKSMKEIYTMNSVNKKSGPDHGDSGGPVFLRIDNNVYLAGITSNGGELKDERFSGYVDLQDEVVKNWIIKNLNH